MNRIDALRRMRELIDAPDKWCQGSFAQDAKGERIGLFEPDACCFCAFGAFRLAFAKLNCDDFFLSLYSLKKAMKKLEVSIPQSFGYDLSVFNDHENTTHADMLKLIDTAIGIAIEEERKRKDAAPEASYEIES